MLAAVPDQPQPEMPCDLVAEAAVLGAMLLSPAAVTECTAMLGAADFYRGAYRSIFEAVVAVAERGEGVDEVTVADELERAGRLADVGGRGAITDIAHRVPTAANAPWYAAKVARTAGRRRLIDLSRDLVSAALDATADLDVLALEVAGRLERAVASVHDLRWVDRVDDAMVARILADVAAGREPGAGEIVALGWPAHDRLVRFQKGLLTVVTGIPGSGKSTWMDAVICGLAAKRGWRWAVFSPESAPTERHVAILARVLLGRKLTAAPADTVEQWVRWVGEHVEWVRSTEGATVPAILRRADELHRMRGIDGLVLDPWNEIDHERPANMREDQHISKMLTVIRRWVRKRGIAGFVVAHPKKMERDRNGVFKMPSLYDISGSATFRDKADIGIVVHRDQRKPGPTEVHVAKVRFGECGHLGVCELFYDEAGDTLGPNRRPL